MELYILRHGTTSWNKTSHLQGSTDIPLDKDGIKLAQETAQGLKNIHFDAVFSSPLIRAVDTAKYVLLNRKLTIQKDLRISEINFGDWEGCDSSANSKDLDPALVSRFFDISKDAITPPHGESISDVLKRTHDFYEDITQNPQYADSRILISTHGGAGRALMHNIWKDKDFWHGCVPPNCSVTIVKLHNNVVTYVKADCIFYGEESLRNYYKF